MPDSERPRSLVDLLVPDGLAPNELERWRFAVMMGLVAIAAAGSYSVVYALGGSPVGAIAEATLCTVAFAILIVAKRKRRLDKLFMVGVALVIGNLSYLSMSSGGFSLSFMMWIGMVPIGVVLGVNMRWMWRLTSFAVVVGTLAFALRNMKVNIPRLFVDPEARDWIDYVSWLLFMACGALLAFMFHSIRSRNEAERARMQESSETSRRMQAIGELAGGVAHEFNNLLTVIRGTATLIQGEDTPADRLAEGLSDIERAAIRGGEIARELLIFARGRTEADEVESADPNESLAACLRLIRPLLSPSIDLVTAIESNLPRAAAKARTLEQSIVNLIINARDAIGDTTGTIRVEADVIELGAVLADRLALADGEWLRVSVSDTGSGMDEATKARIFEPFFTTKESGTGLGLAVVFGLVQQAKGAIDLQSAPGKGTTIDLYLPISDAAAGSTARARTQSGDRLQQENIASYARGEVILIVEDQRAVRRMAARVLNNEGFEVVEAEDGFEALELVEGGLEVPIILSDVRMPRIGGAEMASRLRAQGIDTPIVFMTGFAGSLEEEAELFALGSEVLRKPFAPQELVRAIETHLSQHQRGAKALPA